MKKSTKGALAAGSAAVLLMGGAGTLAYWTESADVTGTTLTAGSLSIADNTCGSAAWTLDGGAAITGATRIVPGDVISKTCSFTINGVGDHLTDVNISIAAPGWATPTAGPNAELVSALGTVTPTYSGSTVGPILTGADLPIGETVTATFSLTFSTATTGNTAENGVATLNNIAITATQNHL